MMKLATTEDKSRVSARVSMPMAEKLQEAADLTGASSISQFMIQAALEKAQNIIDREMIINLTREDAAILITMLDAPPKRSPAMTRALERYKKVKNGNFSSTAERST